MLSRKSADDERWLSPAQRKAREDARRRPTGLAGTGFTGVEPTKADITKKDDTSDPRYPNLLKATVTAFRDTNFNLDTRRGQRAIESTALVVLEESLTYGPPVPNYQRHLRTRLEDATRLITRSDYGSFAARDDQRLLSFALEQIAQLRGS